MGYTSATCNLTNVTIDRDDAVFFILFDDEQREYNNDIYDTIPNFHKFYKQQSIVYEKDA